MTETVEKDTADAQPSLPRLRVTQGQPWRIDAGRRAKWLAQEFLSANAVDVRQIGDPVLHAPAKKPRLARAELEALVARMFASMIVARGIGIAAPQIGVPLRVAIMDVDDAGIVAIDPKIEWTSEEVEECMLHETDHLNGTLDVDRLRSREDLHPVEREEEAPASA